MNRTRLRTPDQRGFTLVELLTTLLLIGILATFAGTAARQYWLRRSLVTSENDAVVTLRDLQQRAVAESNPLVYGARFRQNQTSFQTYRYNPLTGTCVQTGSREFAAGVIVLDAEFDTYRVNDGSDPPTGPPVATLCPGGGSSQRYVFFFARGSATAGYIELTQPRVGSANVRRITVGALTSRIEAREG